MKRSEKWVEPSFLGLTGGSVSASAKRRTSRAEACGREQRQRRSRRAESDQNQAWVDRYQPRSLAELAVHKKKVEEVEAWLRAHSSSSTGGVLLLTGPSGCGKTATVRVLSLELGLRVLEWTNPSGLETYGGEQDWRTDGVPSSSQSAQFQEFLLRSNKYRSLALLGEGAALHRKLILVEDFPNQFYRQPAALHDVLRRFVRTSRCPLVFIVSDGLSGDSSSRLLFPREVQEELGVATISFNPVAPTAMMKVLTSISALEAGQSRGRTGVPDPAVLDTLCSGSSGDVRSAINSLQFSSLTDCSLEKNLWSPRSAGTPGTSRRRKKPRQMKEREEPPAIGGKDSTLFLFRALGKILHCKRGNPERCEGNTEGSEAASLPPHLSVHRRDALQVDPEAVVERSHLSGEFFSLYLHQNYVEFFSQLEDLERASRYLSDADLLTADWTSRGWMEGYGSSLATRGLLHSNRRPLALGFRPLHKPSWLSVSKKHQENCRAAQELFRSFCLPPVALQTELLPYLAKLSGPMRNQAQITFLQDVGHMTLQRFSGRFKLETLMDKEPGQLEEEEEEEEEEGEDEGPEEGLACSQPQAAATRLLLEDDDLNIEEFHSD